MTYEEFIQNILDTRGRFACGDEYHERHHIVPKCIGGGNEEENLIDLYAREHFEAHRLLALQNPENERLIYAWYMMSAANNNQNRYVLTPKEYEDAKKALINVNSIRMAGEGNPMYGKHHSDEAKKIIGDKNRERYSIPENTPMYGKHLTDETKEKIRAHQPDTRGENNPFYGKKHSEEIKEKMREYAQNRPEEHNKKISESCIGKRDRSKNPHSKITIQLDDDLNIINIYGCAMEASEKLGIDYSSLCMCCIGSIKTSGGFQWKYLYDQTRKNGIVILGGISLGIISEEEALRQLNNINGGMNNDNV